MIKEGNDITSRSSRSQRVESAPAKTKFAVGLLKVLDELEQSASNLKPYSTHQNREDREVAPINNIHDTSYQLPGRLDEPGSSGKETGKETVSPTGHDPLATARRRLEAAIDEVAAIWNSLPAPGGDRPWLSPATEVKLDREIEERFRAKDLSGAMAAIENWRSAWLAILPVQPGVQQRDWLAVESEILGGEVIVFARDHQTPVPEPYAGAIRYTVSELEPLQGLDAHSLRAVHAAKKALGGVVGGQDNAMSGESDARRPSARELPGLNDGEILRRLNNPKTPVREWQRCAHAAAARGLVGHAAPANAGGFRPQPFEFCSPEKPAPGHRRWRSFQGVVVCGSCHPPAAPELVAEWLDEPKGGGPQEH